MTISIVQDKQQSLLCTKRGENLGIEFTHFEPEWLLANLLVTGTAEGRGKVYFFKLVDEALVLRHYKRGGLIAKLSDDKFVFSGLESSRPYQELLTLERLKSNGVHVPSPIAARVVRNGLLYSADILTQVIPNSSELHELLQKQTIELETWKNIGREIKKMHDLDVCHYDLNVKNILLDDRLQVHLLDFDKCEVIPPNSSNKTLSTQFIKWKQANLERLLRSIHKQQKSFANYGFDENCWQHLLAGYKA